MPAYVGVDFHVRTQTVCWCDTAKGEVEQRTLDHQRGDLPGFYRQWATPVSQEVLRLVRHRDRLVRIRTQMKNSVQAVALNHRLQRAPVCSPAPGGSTCTRCR